MRHFPVPADFVPLAPIRVLVVDDSASQRGLLSAVLRRAGLEVETAPDPGVALSRLLQPGPSIRMILSDWQMPGMDGPDFCRAVRAFGRDEYVYMILMTSVTDRAQKARGLEAGADDFVTRPLDPAELRARVQTGRRILQMEAQLLERNAQTDAALGELQRMHDLIQRDLAEARQLQRAFLPPAHIRVAGSEVSLRLVTSGQVGGDLVGHFAISPTRIALYSIDVSGHGIASALLTGRLAGKFSWRSPQRNIAFHDPGAPPSRPDRVIDRLNDFMLRELGSDIYFTAVLAYVDLESGAVELCQAGHPHPLLRRADGRVETLGGGGPPVGLLPGARFECVRDRMAPGDMLMCHSDGLTECMDRGGAMLGEDGLAAILGRVPEATEAALDHVGAALDAHAGGRDFDDDISMLMLRFGGA
ncbi:PP2C family protein-serine/threonine phosphatase [Jannaschia ovalis]|uniref:Fused response regulator/phosphatase n=1 Tax=Jannaschia ovalis TaxID=3038773 RepID=A0ABY8L7M7_9RHOB|nr:fused response regulator/phosphatase [Jannaschia sp. GRR-S6-38]WGH77377.1 fused response regulator/phosphatase [Jannaschia sp. GRR-S6-38]